MPGVAALKDRVEIKKSVMDLSDDAVQGVSAMTLWKHVLRHATIR